MIPFLTLLIAGVWVEYNYCISPFPAPTTSFYGTPSALLGTVSGEGCNRWHFHAQGSMGGPGRWSDRLRLTWETNAGAPLLIESVSVAGARGGSDIVAVGSLADGGTITTPHFFTGNSDGTWSMEIVVSAVESGTITTTASVSICRTDWDGDGAWLPADVSGFIGTWFADLSAGTFTGGDFDGSGAVEPGDVSAFIREWASGC